MSEDNHSREYGQHLVDELLKGEMTRRQLLIRASVFGFSATAIGGLLAAGGESPARASSPQRAAAAITRGGVPKCTCIAPLSALDPVTMYQTGDIATVEMICEYLAWVQKDLTLEPVLALSWSPNATGQVWTFKLRQGVTFSDGSPLEADDVVATFERLVNPSSGSGALSALKGILSPGGTRKVDEYTVAFHLDKPFADFPYLVSSGDYNSVILPRTFAGDFVTSPIGTGPFMLSSYVTGQSATLKRNPTYWQKGLPYLDGVQFVYDNDSNSQALQLEAGAVDLEVQMPFAGSEPLFTNPNITVLINHSTAIREVAMRVDKAPYSNKNVRQAVAYCLDRKGIMKELYSGRGTQGNDQIFSPLYPNSPSFPNRSQNYAKAKQLLAAGGHKSGVSLTITTAAAYLDLAQYAEIIQAMCKPAGIHITLNTMSSSEFYGGSASSTPWLNADMTIVEWSPRPIAAQYIQAMLTKASVWNSAHWANPQFDKLFNQYEATVDEASRKAIAKKMGALEQDQTPVLLAFWMDSLRATSKKLHNVQGLEAYLNLTNAYMTS